MATDHAGPASAYRIVIHRLFTPFRQEKTVVAANRPSGRAFPVCAQLTAGQGTRPTCVLLSKKKEKAAPEEAAGQSGAPQTRRYNADRA